MKSKPIIFSGPMVRAILDGRKTQTRRVVKLNGPYTGVDDGQAWYMDHYGDANPLPCPYGQPGDELFVRETFRFPASLDEYSPTAIGEKALDANYRNPWSPTKYEADGAVRLASELNEFGDGKWGKTRVSIHMPRWASRITLTIKNVRVERLQDISEEDAKAEGCDGKCPVGNVPAYQEGPHSYHFAQLWESINGEGSWQANPWVWVISYERKS